MHSGMPINVREGDSASHKQRQPQHPACTRAAREGASPEWLMPPKCIPNLLYYRDSSLTHLIFIPKPYTGIHP